MVNSCSSALPLFNAFDMLISNTANVDVTMLTDFMTFASFLWYFLVSAVAMPLTLAPARGMVPEGILAERPMNILDVAVLDIPEATFRPLEQAFSHVSRSKVLEYFSNVDINPFGDHDKMDTQPDKTSKTIPLNPEGVGRGATWEPEREQETSFGGKLEELDTKK